LTAFVSLSSELNEGQMDVLEKMIQDYRSKVSKEEKV